jgi:sister chromatid cohesion protein DCC1
MSAIATVHETVELVPEMTEAVKPAAAARGKWHEKFGKSR